MAEPSPPPALPGALAWVGRPLDGIASRGIGKVAGIQVDADDGRPRWVVVRLGRLSRSTAIPFEHVVAGGDRLWAAYERGWLREGPRVRAGEPLSREQEVELCAHCGISEGSGRAGELEGRPTGQPTAVPAQDRVAA
jgi:hypothetical protein